MYIFPKLGTLTLLRQNIIYISIAQFFLYKYFTSYENHNNQLKITTIIVNSLEITPKLVLKNIFHTYKTYKNVNLIKIITLYESWDCYLTL